MRLDKLTSDMAPDGKPPANLQAVYDDPEIQAEWEALYGSDEEHQNRMKKYHADLKKRGLLPAVGTDS